MNRSICDFANQCALARLESVNIRRSTTREIPWIAAHVNPESTQALFQAWLTSSMRGSRGARGIRLP
jgi:hypothetical protein